MTTKFQQYARNNYKPLEPIDEMWHPEIIAECGVMNKEELDRKLAEEEKKKAERSRIKTVVESTADIDAMMTGKISFHIAFSGTVAKVKPLTKEEAAIVMKLPPEVKGKIGGTKPLLVSPELDALMKWISDRRELFKQFGLPNPLQDSTTIIEIPYIPDVEALAEKTELELPMEVEKFLAVYQEQVYAQQYALGPLWNASDYKRPDAVRAMFKFRYDWTGHGALEALKQTNVAFYKKAMERAAEQWKEIEAKGVVMMRETIADLVTALADSLTPGPNGEKRKFYASSVKKIEEFVLGFSRRNICKDAALEAEVEELRQIVCGVDLDKLSAGERGDDAMRERVRKQMEAAKATLSELVVDANLRVIEL
jgi:cation transport regulator ChaB